MGVILCYTCLLYAMVHLLLEAKLFLCIYVYDAYLFGWNVLERVLNVHFWVNYECAMPGVCYKTILFRMWCGAENATRAEIRIIFNSIRMTFVFFWNLD